MLRLNKRRRLKFPTKTVVEDCLTRVRGDMSSDAYSPFPGMDFLIEEQFGQGLNTKQVFSLSEFLKYVQNSDVYPYAVRSEAVVENGILYEGETGEDLVLEDIADRPSVVEKYIRELLIGFKRNEGSVYNNENYTNFITSTYDAEADKFTDVRDRAVIENETDIDFMYDTKKELASLLKEMHARSIEMRVHLFSFIRAYYCIAKTKDFRNEMIRPADFNGYVLYGVGPTGHIRRTFDHRNDNNNEHYRAARRVVCGELYDEYDKEINKLCNKIMTYYMMLGIDLSKEDPTKYTPEFIDSIIIDYIPTNEEYMSKYKNIDLELAAALEPEALFSKVYTITAEEDEDVVNNSGRESLDIIANLLTLKRIPDTDVKGNIIDDGWCDRTEDVAKFFNLMYNVNNGFLGTENEICIGVEEFYTSNGLICYGNDVMMICGNILGVPIGYENVFVYGSIDGYIIVYSTDIEDKYYITVDEAFERIDSYLNGYSYDTGWYSL